MKSSRRCWKSAPRRNVERAPTIGGETGAGPVHWYEFWEAKSARTSRVIDPKDGRVPPLTPGAQKRVAARAAAARGRGPSDSWEDRSLGDRCIVSRGGWPHVIVNPGSYGNLVQILQSPGYVVIVHEMIHNTRVIPVDGRPHIGKDIRQYVGDPRGHWEGNTLVVEVTNFSDKTDFRGSRETLRLVERFTRVDADTIAYEVTIDDPTTFTRPWTLGVPLKSDPGQTRDLRVRVPRRQLRDEEHPQRSPGGRTGGRRKKQVTGWWRQAPSSAPTRSSRCSAQAAWARSIAHAIPGSAATSR